MPLIINMLIFAALSMLIGLGSAWYMVEKGTALTASQLGPWQVWPKEGHLEADPYTRARMARSGRLPITGSLYFTARSDQDGRQLNSGCDYEITGRPLNALWWSLTVYDASGELIANKADRHAFNGENIALLPDGSYRIRVASQARPGNWLPSGQDQQLMLILRAYRPMNAKETESDRVKLGLLPQIRKVECS